jgi:hypothetical protein
LPAASRSPWFPSDCRSSPSPRCCCSPIPRNQAVIDNRTKPRRKQQGSHQRDVCAAAHRLVAAGGAPAPPCGMSGNFPPRAFLFVDVGQNRQAFNGIADKSRFPLCRVSQHAKSGRRRRSSPNASAKSFVASDTCFNCPLTCVIMPSARFSAVPRWSWSNRQVLVQPLEPLLQQSTERRTTTLP